MPWSISYQKFIDACARSGFSPFDEQGARRDIIAKLLNPAATEALDALGKGTPPAIDPARMDDFLRSLPLYIWRALGELVREGRQDAPLKHLALIWLMHDARVQARVTPPRIGAEQHLRKVAPRKFSELEELTTLIKPVETITIETEIAFGRPDPLRPPPGVYDHIEALLAYLEPLIPAPSLRNPPFWCNVAGVTWRPDTHEAEVKKGTEPLTEVGKQSAIGAFAVTVSGLTGSRQDDAIARLTTYFLRSPVNVRDVGRRRQTFLIERGFSSRTVA